VANAEMSGKDPKRPPAPGPEAMAVVAGAYST
jgi:hypothetical protein